MAFELFGFQAGAGGFVRRGIDQDFLFSRVVGGRGSAKTYAGALRTLNYISRYDGCRGMVTAPTNDKLNDATFPALRDVLQKAGLKQGEHWEYHNTRRELGFFTGTLIFFRTTEIPEHLPGPSLAFIWMDEYQGSPEIAFTELIPALRQTGYPHQAWLTGTPAGKAHWGRKVWLPKAYAMEFDQPVYERMIGQYVTYRAETADNPYGGKEVDALMKSTYGENSPMYRQQALGEEITVENLRFDLWDRQKFVVQRDKWPTYPEQVVAGVDFGFTHPSAILVVGRDEAGRRYILHSFSRSRMAEGELAEVAKNVHEKYDVRRFYCDSADPRWIRVLRQAGLPAVNAKKSLGTMSDPTSGFGLCYSALSRTVDGQQAFFVDPSCTAFIREVENFAEENTKGNPYSNESTRRQRDDCISCWRYAEMGLKRMWEGPQIVTQPRGFSMG